MTVEIHYVIIPAALLSLLSVLAGGAVGLILVSIFRRLFNAVFKKIQTEKRNKRLRRTRYIASQKARRDSRRDSLFMDMCRQIEFIDGEGA